MQPVAMSSGQAGAEIRIDGGAPTLTCLHEAPIVAGALCKETFSGGMGGRPDSAVAAHVLPVAIQGNLIGRDAGGPNGVGASADGTMYTLTKADVHGVAQPVGIFQDSEFGVAQYDSAGTLRAGRIPEHQMAMQPPSMAVRRLTPVECERLQGFPDGYTNIPWRGKPESPDGPRYKALGNSMAVPVMRWIGERIEFIKQMRAAA